MAEEVIHIYIDSLIKTDTGTISSSKKRLWPSIIVSLRWILQNPISSRTIAQNGLGLIVVNSLAIAVEGFLTDILVDYHDNNEIQKSELIKKIENSNWNSKVKIYNTTFTNKLDECICYKTVDILLLLRNNIAHGRTHREIREINAQTSKFSPIESSNKNYQRVREYLQEKRLFDKNDNLSNIESLWGIKSISFFMYEARMFLYELLKLNKSDKFALIQSELDNAFKMTL